MTKVESPASLTLVQRQIANISRAAESSLGDATNRRAAVTAEIRAASSGASKPAMVWRQSADRAPSGGALADGTTGNARIALPLAISAARGGEPQVARQAATAEPASSTNSESTGPVAATTTPATPPANEIDVAQLAEQVSRVIARQLTVERERRGRSGWR